MSDVTNITRIPHAAANAICEKHGDFWGLTEDPSATVVRKTAEVCREMGDPASLAQARDLDALVDAVERGGVSA
jgi:hypothetical protein